MGEAKIIVVANQKGGAGKSTLCMLLGNFLHKEKNFDFGGIIDTDFQKSIYKTRDADRRLMQGTDGNGKLGAPYQVVSYQLTESSNLKEFIDQLRATKRDAYIIDTPGSINSPGLNDLLSLADYILCPFDYDKLTLGSTLQFLQHLHNIKMRVKRETDYDLPTQIILVPCRSPKKSGTREEIKNWEAIRDKLKESYHMVKEIPQSQEIKHRCNTIELSNVQKKVAMEALTDIFNIIFNPNINNYNEQDEE